MERMADVYDSVQDMDDYKDLGRLEAEFRRREWEKRLDSNNLSWEERLKEQRRKA